MEGKQISCEKALVFELKDLFPYLDSVQNWSNWSINEKLSLGKVRGSAVSERVGESSSAFLAFRGDRFTVFPLPLVFLVGVEVGVLESSLSSLLLLLLLFAFVVVEVVVVVLGGGGANSTLACSPTN